MTSKEAAAVLGRIKSPAKAAASRANGKLGGRPRKKQPVEHPPIPILIAAQKENEDADA